MTENQKQQQRQRIGQRIAEIRKVLTWTDDVGLLRRGMTQRDLADKCGIQATHIARIEKGRYSVGFDTLQTIADAMGMDVDFIIKQ